MASAWGLSFGSAWGNAWGAIGDIIAATQGAGSYDKKKRRRNIVNVDGVLYEFATEAEAISFLNLQDESVSVAEKVTQPVPVKTVNIETVESLSESAIINATPNEIYNYIQFADYAAIIKAYDQWLELDEEEALLLLM